MLVVYWKEPTLTKHDLEICCFLKFGLSHEELSCIFHTTSDSVTRAKGRLKGRLGISPQEDLDLFEGILRNKKWIVRVNVKLIINNMLINRLLLFINLL